MLFDLYPLHLPLSTLSFECLGGFFSEKNQCFSYNFMFSILAQCPKVCSNRNHNNNINNEIQKHTKVAL